jgi:threonylcarbamoyladenosine tRNA methylthiotransferase MtaB
MRYSLVTFGCRVNQADSLGFEEELLARGASPAEVDAADLVIVNTCSVTAAADQGARQTIRRIARSNPSARIVVTGCYASRCPDELATLPGVSRVVVNGDKERLVSDFVSDLTTAERFGSGEGSCGAPIQPGVAGRTAFTLRVQTGCDEPCAYCIIPATRGAPRSLSADRVEDDVRRARSAGFKEIVLTGVHLGSYGRDLGSTATLAGLLRRLATSAPDVLFRISSLEPMDCTREIVDIVAAHDCFAPHFHLPLQHASDAVLARMRRPYTGEQYAALAQAIRERMPDASIGTDLIAGFPRETDAEFAVLVDFVERSPLTHVHVFPYSDRPGTAATAMDGKVHGSVVRERASALREIGRRLTDRFHQSQAGTTHRALTIDDGSVAVTDNYLKVHIPAGRTRNEWVRVRIDGINPLTASVVV